MRIGFLSSLSLLLVGSSLALAQPGPQQAEVVGQNSLPADAPNAFDPDQPEPCDFCWASGEFIWWWMTKVQLPPLVTTAPTMAPGILGSPPNVFNSGPTQVLFGGQELNDKERLGGRATIGWCFQEEHRLCVETSFFALGDRSNSFRASSDANGDQTLARPVINALTGQETVESIALSGQFAGSVEASLKSQLLGGDLNFFYNPFNRFQEYPDFFIGSRYLNLDETLEIGQRTTILPGGVSGFAGGIAGGLLDSENVIAIHDRFNTLNQYYGGQVGLREQFDRGCWFLNVLAAMGFGTTSQHDKIDGSTSLLPPNPINLTVPGGLLALASNSGNTSHTEFTVVPEFRLTLGVYLTSHLQASVGYNFLYWSAVIRPGSEIDRRINPTQLPTSTAFGALSGPALPAPLFQEKDLMLQGLNFGLSYRF